MHRVGLRGLKLPVRLVRIMLSGNYSMETYQHIYITLAHPWGPWLEDTDDEPKYIGLQAVGAFLIHFGLTCPRLAKRSSRERCSTPVTNTNIRSHPEESGPEVAALSSPRNSKTPIKPHQRITNTLHYSNHSGLPNHH
jgi:hypothetical protein